MAIVAPSVLSADFSCLRQAVDLLNRSEAQWIHWDVMDGRFVPNLTFGMPVVKALRPYSEKFFDVHLMIVEPSQYTDAFAAAGADQITVHCEADVHLHRTVQRIRDKGIKAGVALNPATPVACVEEIIPFVDTVLVMSVNPGFGGQAFIPQVLDKVRRLKALIREKNPACLIEIDGGINAETASVAVQAGADVLVAGSYVFGHPSPLEAIRILNRAGQ
ncbi:MAG: ribulose-phosphate 3-epimerase [Chlorobi bacterium]|nr:ribulose-phosphate 3-epimerase [Chlorobiota bacterium]